MTKVQIGPWQVLTLLANLVFGKSIGYTNGVLARTVGRDTWLAMTLAYLTGMLVITAMVWLARRRGRELPTQYIPRLLGRFLGAVVMLLLALFFLGAYITSAITIEQHISDYLMTETPFVIFVIGYNLMIWYGVYLGIEVAARLSVLGLVLNMALNVAMVLGAVDMIRPDRLFPLFDNGVLPVVAASFKAAQDVGIATAAALMLLPLNANRDRWLKVSLWGLGIGAVLVLTWSLCEMTVLGPEVTAQYLIACMQMARAAELSIYLHRYEMIMVVLFVYGVITQSVVCLYCATELTAAALPWKPRRSWLIGIAVAITGVAQYFLGYDRDLYGVILSTVWPVAAVALAYGLPLLLCLVALFRPVVRPKPSTKGA